MKPWITGITAGLVEDFLFWESLLMRLNGTLALEPATFGAIKATLGH